MKRTTKPKNGTSNHGLNPRQKRFAEEVVYDWNATRAYQIAYPRVLKSTASTLGYHLLRDAKVRSYIEQLKRNIEEHIGISRAMVAKEYMKIAFTSMGHLHNDWISRKEFDQLSDEQKSCISEISTQIKVTRQADGSLEENEFIKVKLYNKVAALDSLTKFFGYAEPERFEGNIGHSHHILGAESIPVEELSSSARKVLLEITRKQLEESTKQITDGIPSN